MDAVERIDDLSVEDFKRDFLEKNRPVITKCRDPKFAAEGSGPLAWDLDFLKARCGSNVVSVKKFSKTLAHPDGQEDMTLGDYIDLTKKGQSGFPRFYLKNQPLHAAIPELVESVPIPGYVERSGRSVESFQKHSHIYVGRDAQTSMHFHPREEAVTLVVQGQKDFLLFAPNETKNLYANPWYTWPKFGVNQSNLMFSENEVVNGPKPRFDPSRGIHVRLTAGDMMFIPAHWWHAVYTPDVPTVMLVYWFPSRLRRWWKTPQAPRASFQKAHSVFNRQVSRVKRRLSRS